MQILGISMTEWVGYLASFLVLLSFTMKKVTLLRAINMIACIFWVIYGLMLDISWPIIVANSAIFLVNGFHLFNKK